MKDDKEYIEPEIIKNGAEKIKDFGQDKMGDMEGHVKSIKQAIVLKGISTLALPILIFISVIGGITWLIMYVIDTHPFDYMLAGLFLFFILSPIYKLIRMFK